MPYKAGYLLKNGVMFAQTAGKLSIKTWWAALAIMANSQLGIILYADILVSSGALGSSYHAISNTGHLILPNNALLTTISSL